MFSVDIGPAMGVPTMGDMGGGDGTPQWDGGHSFSSAAVHWSLDNILIPQLKAANQGWTEERARQEARGMMARRLWENRAFDRQERDRDPEIVKEWQISETSEGVFELTTDYAGTSISLRQLWENMYKATHDRSNAATYNPAAYNAAEARAQLQIQDALISGKAAAAITILSDVDSHRYAQVWEKKESGISSKVVDLSLAAGHDFSSQEAQVIMEQIGMMYGDKTVSTEDDSYPVVMLTESSVRSDDLKIIAQMQPHPEVSQNTNLFIQTATDIPRGVGNIMNELHVTGELIRKYLERDLQERSANTLEQLMDPLSAKKSLAELLADPEKEQALQQLTMEGLDQSIESMTESEVRAFWLTKAQEVLHIAPEQAEELLHQVEQTYEEMVGAQEVIAVIVDDEQMQTAMSPLLFVALEELAHPEVSLLSGEETVAQEGIGLTSEEKEAVIAYFMADLEDSISQELVRKEDALPESVDRVVLVRVKEFIQKIHDMTIEEAVQAIEHEEEVVVIQMSELWEVFAKLRDEQRQKSATPKNTGELELAIGTENNQRQESEHEHVENFSFAFTLWMLLKLDSYYRSLQALKNFVLGKEPSPISSSEKSDEPLNLLQKLKEKMPEGLIQKETTQWLLFAIIWHLSMLREAGVQQNHNGQQTYPQKQAKKVQGVIFAYAT